MSDLNISSGNDNGVEKNTKKNQTSKELFLKEFSKKTIDSRNVVILDEVYKIDSIDESSELKKVMSDFIANTDIEELKDFDFSKITIFDLKRKFSSYFFQINNSRNILKSIIYKNYDVSDKDIKEIEKEINKLDQKDLLINIKSDLKIKTLLKKVGNFKKKDLDISFLNFSGNDISTRLQKLIPYNMLDEVKTILLNIYEGKIVDTEIVDIFSTNFFTSLEKKQLVLDFIPTTSLGLLVKIGYYSQSDADKIKKYIILDLFGEELKNQLGEDNFNNIVSSTNLEDVIIDIKTLNLDDDSILKIGKEIGFKNLEDDFKSIIREDIINKKNTGPQTLEILKKKLEENSKNLKIKDIEKFSKGNFVEIIIKDEKGNTKNTFLKVKDFDDDKKILKFFEVGSNNIISFSSNTEKEIDYFDFLNLSLKKNINIVFHSENDLKDKVKTGEITTNELFSYSKEDLNNDENRKNYSKKFIESKQKELDKFKKLQSEGKLTNLDREKMNSIEKIVNSGDFSDEQLLDFLNFETLLSKLDDIDPDGKDLKLGKGVLLQAKDGGIHEIIGVPDGEISDGEISVKTLGQDVVFSYDEFYETFSRLKTKRVKKIKDFGELLSDFEKKSDKWKGFSFENDKLSIKEENKKNPNKKVEYLISDKNDDIVKIHEISGDKITVSFGERKQKGSLDKKDKNYKDKSEEEILFIKGAKKVTYNLNQFKSQILDDEKYGFRPSWETGKTLENNEVNSNNKFKSGFFTKLFDKSSFLDLISGSKMLLNSIEDTLKRGNDLKAARFALSMGGFLPEELRAELQIKVEREEAESMDKALDGLSKVDSPIAVNRIKGWLLNKNTPEYKKEAGLMFMLSKYGHLTAKGPLYEFRGKYIWYEAFGGKFGDPLYLDVKKECEESEITFSEEYLMHRLLKKQCFTNYNGIKRRSRLHKEFEGKWGGGIKDEVEKGYSDASKKRKASDMVKGGMDEASGGTTSNAIGWFKKAVERGGSIEDMSEGFFCLLYSGACYELDQKTYLNIRDLWGSGMPIMMTKFFSTVPEMNLFNDTILELSKEIGKAYPNKFPNIVKEAQDIYDSAKSKKGSEKERLLKTQKFWKNYGKPLSRSLNMLHTDKGEYSKTDKVLFLKKDENPILGAMYSKIRIISGEGGTFKEDYMGDSCGAEGLSGLDVYRIVIKYLAKNTGGGFVSKDTGPVMWQKITEDLKSTNSKVFSDDANEDLKLKKIYLTQTLREIVSGIIELHGGNEPVLLAFNNLTTETGIDFRNWGLNISDFKEFSPSRILKGDSDDKLMNAVDNILGGRDEFAKSSNKIESVFDTIKSSIDTHLK
ncbi:hypothetical protein HUU51_02090 [Candidatus Gracilibacteria bacterium]|nr:hypothetical protein [Candidatus Gracilibacteria bacterium]